MARLGPPPWKLVLVKGHIEHLSIPKMKGMHANGLHEVVSRGSFPNPFLISSECAGPTHFPFLGHDRCASLLDWIDLSL